MRQIVFFDLDECLIETHFDFTNPSDSPDDFIFTLDNDPTQYRTKVRPTARKILAIARELFGEENVYMLTTSTDDYSAYINKKAELGFAPERIFHRGTIADFKAGKYKGNPDGRWAELGIEGERVLIDNLAPRFNWDKLYFLDIGTEDYLKVDCYDAHDTTDSEELKFFEDVKTFLYQFKNSQTA